MQINHQVCYPPILLMIFWIANHLILKQTIQNYPPSNEQPTLLIRHKNQINHCLLTPQAQYWVRSLYFPVITQNFNQVPLKLFLLPVLIFELQLDLSLVLKPHSLFNPTQNLLIFSETRSQSLHRVLSKPPNFQINHLTKTLDPLHLIHINTR